MTYARRLLAVTGVATTLLLTAAAGPASAPSPTRFEKEIVAFEQEDRAHPPQAGGVLFVGDSGFRMWKTVVQDFPEQHVINRGFGGSTMADALYYTDRIVFPYQPRLIVLREGGNDLTTGVTPEQLLSQVRAFVETVRGRFPEVRVAICSLNPNPARWGQAETRKRVNAMLKGYVASGKNLDFIEVWDQFLGADGKPRAELFLKDGLHNNEAGYKIYADIVRPHLK